MQLSGAVSLEQCSLSLRILLEMSRHCPSGRAPKLKARGDAVFKFICVHAAEFPCIGGGVAVMFCRRAQCAFYSYSRSHSANS
jgi:hypothetical protein